MVRPFRIEFVVPITPDFYEDVVWEDRVLPRLEGAPPNVLSICKFGFTEMLNNVASHSESPQAAIVVAADDAAVSIVVMDWGVGIFRKIRDALSLSTNHEAVLELTKGKFTTDPERHSGEGLFYTARMFDEFHLMSGEIFLRLRANEHDWWLEGVDRLDGTHVEMEIALGSPRTTLEVYERFAHQKGDLSLDRTTLAVRMLEPQGGGLVSRSQAKRLVARLEQFRTVVLDFGGVSEIGPAFADEVFRVFTRSHPDVRLVPMNTEPAVEAMIRKVTDSAANGACRPDPSG